MNKQAKQLGSILCASILFGSLASSLDVCAKAKAKKAAAQASTVNYNDPAIKEVKEHYTAGRWKDALKKIATMKPNDLTHYYTGLCYQGQNQVAKAAMEFQWIATYGKDPKLKYNSQVILNSLSAYSSSRRYAGQGNEFSRVSRGGYSRSGGSRGG